MLLATIGLYGIMTYNVAGRNEMACGSRWDRAGRVVRMVLAEVSRVVIAGTLISIGLSLA